MCFGVLLIISPLAEGGGGGVFYVNMFCTSWLILMIKMSSRVVFRVLIGKGFNMT